MKPQAIIFDFNGVMIDDYPLQKQIWDQLSQTIRHRPVTDDEMVHHLRGVPAKDNLRWLSHDHLSQTEIDELARTRDALEQQLFQTSSDYRLMPGLQVFLDQLKAKHIPRTIATSSRQDVFRFSFDTLKLERWFKWGDIFYQDGSYPGKPAADPYLRAARQLGFSPAQCLVVEDALSGITSAQAAGVQNIIVVGRQYHEFATLTSIIAAARDFTKLAAQDFFV